MTTGVLHFGRDSAQRTEADVYRAIRTLSPVRIAGWSFLLFFVGLIVAPVEPAIGFSATALAFFSLSVAAAFTGMALPLRLRAKPYTLKTWSERFDWRIFARRCVALATVGVGLTIIDRFFVRGVPIGTDIFEARSTIEDAGVGLLAVLAAFFSSFAAFGWISVRLARAFGHPVGRSIELLALLNLSVYVGLSIALGSRSLLLACLLLHAFAMVFIRRIQGLRLRKSEIAAGIVVLIAVITALASILEQRLTLMGLSIIDSIQFSAYADTLKPTSEVLDFLAEDDFLQSFGAAVYSMILYVFHGFYEFLLLFDSYHGEFTNGAQTLWFLIKLAGVVMPMSEPIDIELFGYRSGIFTTFAGPFFVDFGNFAALFILIAFFLLAVPFRKLMAGDPRWLFAALQVNVIVAFSPAMPLLQSAVGIYPLFAAVSMIALIPKVRGRRPRNAARS